MCVCVCIYVVYNISCIQHTAVIKLKLGTYYLLQDATTVALQ